MKRFSLFITFAFMVVMVCIPTMSLAEQSADNIKYTEELIGTPDVLQGVWTVKAVVENGEVKTGNYQLARVRATEMFFPDSGTRTIEKIKYVEFTGDSNAIIIMKLDNNKDVVVQDYKQGLFMVEVFGEQKNDYLKFLITVT